MPRLQNRADYQSENAIALDLWRKANPSKVITNRVLRGIAGEKPFNDPWRGADFSYSELSGMDICESLLRCDLSYVKWSDFLIKNITFDSCVLVGSMVSGSYGAGWSARIHDTTVKTSLIDFPNGRLTLAYSNIEDSTIDAPELRFEKARMRSSRIGNGRSSNGRRQWTKIVDGLPKSCEVVLENITDFEHTGYIRVLEDGWPVLDLIYWPTRWPVNRDTKWAFSGRAEGKRDFSQVRLVSPNRASVSKAMSGWNEDQKREVWEHIEGVITDTVVA